MDERTAGGRQAHCGLVVALEIAGLHQPDRLLAPRLSVRELGGRQQSHGLAGVVHTQTPHESRTFAPHQDRGRRSAHAGQ